MEFDTFCKYPYNQNLNWEYFVSTERIFITKARKTKKGNFVLSNIRVFVINSFKFKLVPLVS